MSGENRSKRRQKLSWPGAITGRDGSFLGDCRISDVSASGAKLILADEVHVPEEFILKLTDKGVVRRLCKVMWRSGQKIGVQFSQF